jgi:phenylacetate-CoA ligase
VNRALAAGLFFPLQELLKRKPTLRVLREVRATEGWSASRVAALQEERVAAALRDAAATPYYAERFRAAGVAPDDFRALPDLARFPFLTREDLRRRRDDLLHPARRSGLKLLATGGSTGEPVRVWACPLRVAHTDAARLRARAWWGIRIGDPEVVFWASPLELGAQDRLRAWRDRLLNSTLVSAFHLTPASLDAAADTMARAGAVQLYGYAGSLALFARHLLRTGRRRPAPALRATFTTAEPLPEPDRAALAEALGAPVGVEYGARDAGLLAHECPARGLHVMAESVHVEIVRDGRPVAPGERGEVVVTHLRSPAFPLIRYRTGDLAALRPGPCPCGRALPVLEPVEGRTADCLVGVDGRVVHALGAIYPLRELSGVRRFQVEQVGPRELVVRIEREAGFADDALPRVREQLERLLGGPVEVRFEFPGEIAAAASGKHRYVIRRVPLEPS